MARLHQLACLCLGLSFVACAAGASATIESGQEQAHALHTRYGAYDLTSDSLPELADAVATPAVANQIVQFTGAIRPAWRQALLDQNIVILGYFPDDAYVVRATVAQVQQLGELPYVRAVAAMPRLLKVHPHLLEQSTQGARLMAVAPHQARDVLVELWDSGSRTDVAAWVRSAGGHVYPGDATSRLLRIRGESTLLGALAAMPQVSSLEPVHAMHLFNDSSYGLMQSGQVHNATIWQHGILGLGQLVAVADTGVDPKSCFFAGSKLADYQNYAQELDYDGEGHGTHVAGSIAGDRGANNKYDEHDGMAPAAHLVVQDVGDGGDLTGIPDDLGELFEGAYAKGARIHSNSWGGGDNSYDAIARSVDAFVATHRDFLALFANGNEGYLGNGSVRSPATAKSVISVAAVVGTRSNTLAPFSSRGPTADGRTKPTLAAPGVDVVSAMRGAACDVTTLSGTSMATPTAAGGAALAREYFTDGFYPSGQANPNDSLNPSAALLKAVLIAGADNLATSSLGTFPGQGQGFGRVHLDNALLFNEDARRLWVHDEESAGLETASQAKYTVHHAGGVLRVVLTWSDQPGSAGADKALVNNLDLTLTGPQGTVYRGNVLSGGNSLAQSTRADATNVEEIVHLGNAPAGDYVIGVAGTSVPMGPQTYALAAVGSLLR